MRILHITTQKPNSTGSGVYMSGLIENLNKLGHKQSVIAGIDVNDTINCFSHDISFYPVIYNTEELPFAVVGMSDIMPYNSTRYKDLNSEMVFKLKKQYLNILDKAIKEFKPDIIICNHLYLITSFIREAVKDIKVIGLCHGTCLRQLKNIDLEKEYIISNIQKLDKVFVLHDKQKEDVSNLFNIGEDKISIIGSGYNNKIFYAKNYEKNNDVINIAFAGKICSSKGIKSLLLSLDKLKYPKESIILNIAGSGGDEYEYEKMLQLAKKSKYKVNFLGRLNHDKLSELFNRSHIFVLPSFYEGLPIVILEALSCGCRVIVSDIKGVKDWMGDKINNSGLIRYINLPKMKSAGIPFNSELCKFEEELSNIISEEINKINFNEKEEVVDLEDKTWTGLSNKVSKIIKEL